MPTEEKNLEDLSLDEIRKLAEEEAAEEAKKVQAAAAASQPRNEDGTFAAKKEEEADPAAEPEEFCFERVVDLGDGSGRQVFRGKGATKEEALEQLADNLAKAQENATKKIRELAKKVPAPAAEEKKFTADEEFVYSQELLSKPTEAIKKLFKDVVGVDVKEFKNAHDRQVAISSAEQTRVERQQTGDAFIVAHPEYVDSEKNSAAMKEVLDMSGDYSQASFEKAYQYLKKSGLLELKAEEAHAGAEAEKPQEERIAQRAATEVTPQRTKRASGISTKNRPAVSTASAEPSEDELYDTSKYSLEDVRRLANKQLASRK